MPDQGAVADLWPNPASDRRIATTWRKIPVGARSDEPTRAVATDGFRKLVDVMARRFGDVTPKAARRRALVEVSTMIGALTMSRMVSDPDLSAEILREAEASLSGPEPES